MFQPVRLITAAIALTLLSACASRSGSPTAVESAAAPSPDTYMIGPGDTLQIFVWQHPEVSATVPVRPDGKISTPLVEDMQAVGKTPVQVRNSPGFVVIRPAGQVGIEDRVPVLLRDVLGLLAERPPGGVDEDVDPSERLDDRVAQPVDARPAGDVHLVPQRPPPERLDRRAHFLGQLLAPAGRDDVRAALGQRDRDRLAEPGRPADHDGDPAGQVGDVLRGGTHEEGLATDGAQMNTDKKQEQNCLSSVLICAPSVAQFAFPLSSSSCDGTFGRFFVDSGSAAAR